MESAKWKSTAKINLTLEILGRRDDGFHELRTLMVPVALWDELDVRVCDSGTSVVTEGMNLPDGPENLAWRAAEAVRQECGIDTGVRILLRKRIPAGGGLAGGSGNAVAVMRAVNELWNAGLDDNCLHRLAAGLGSDLNFFLVGGPAICGGRGERVSAVELECPRHVVLINPGFGVPTPWAFRTYAARPEAGVEGRLEVRWREGSKETRVRLRNDLEPAVFSKYPWLLEAKAWCLRQPGVEDALMSGSGATVFALCDSAGSAAKLVAQGPTHFGDACTILATELLL